MITFRQVVDQRPDAGSGAGGPDPVTPDAQALHELWPEAVEPAVPHPPMPRYRRIAD